MSKKKAKPSAIAAIRHRAAAGAQQVRSLKRSGKNSPKGAQRHGKSPPGKRQAPAPESALPPVIVRVRPPAGAGHAVGLWDEPGFRRGGPRS